jgi:hypothetical protein
MNEKPPIGLLEALKETLSIPAGRFGFILMVISTIGCFVVSSIFKGQDFAVTGSMLFGVFSVVGCQQFIRVISVVIASHNQDDE